MNWLDGRIISDRGQARFEPATDLPAWPLPGRAPAGGNIRLAIRPEAVAWGAVTDQGPVSWPATVPRVEVWGASSWAVLDVAGACWWARWPGPGTVRVGDAVQLRPDPATAHWFDALSGLRIEPD